jgi:endonuclease/exonuclease/phosphatase (EEP) superfamily protein YafD
MPDEPAATVTIPQPSTVKVAMRWRAWAALFGLSAIAGACGSWWWLFDLFAHFLPYQTVGLAVCAVGLWWKRDRIAAGITTIVLIGCLWFIGPYYMPRPVPTAGERFSLRVCNVFCHNTEPERVLKLLRDSPTDVVVLLEVTIEWSQRFQDLRDVYPHMQFEPEGGSFGIGVLSRKPWANLNHRSFGRQKLPSLTIDFPLERGGTWLLVATHPLPPISSFNAAARDEQLARVATYCNEHDGPIVVAGDHNASPWSHAFRGLCHDGRLTDSSLGFGIHPTWPTIGPLAVIPIDHILTRGMGVSSRQVEPRVGSDHHPVRTDLVIP